MKPKIDYIVLLRVIAIILVVFAHATRDIYTPNPHMYTPLTMAWWELPVRNYIVSFHMPLFFWISGFVFYFSVVENKKTKNVFTQIYGKIKRLLIPLYVTSFFILLPTIFFFGHINGSLLHQIKLFLLVTNNDHLWFLQTLFIIFVIYIPLNYYKKNDSGLFYIMLLAMWVIVYYNKEIIPTFFHEALINMPFFIIGCLSRKYEFLIKKKKYSVLFGILFLFHFVLWMFESTIAAFIPTVFLFYLIAFSGIYFMYFLTKAVHEGLSHAKSWKMIKKIDDASYTIYLFHVSFLYFVLFITYKFNIDIPEIRIAFSFILGLILPIYIHAYLSKHKILSYAFSIPFKKATQTRTKA